MANGGSIKYTVGFNVDKSGLNQLKASLQELKQNNLLDLFTNIEMPLVDVLLSMERTGVKIDTDQLNKFSLLLQEHKQELEERIYQLAGKEFNIASPKQLGVVLFEDLQITGNQKIKKTQAELANSKDSAYANSSSKTGFSEKELKSKVNTNKADIAKDVANAEFTISVNKGATSEIKFSSSNS